MKSRTVVLISIFALGLIPGPLPTQAQQAPRIGFISFGSSPDREAAFRKGLHDLGYFEGENIVIEWRSAEKKLHRLPGIAAELIRLKVKVIVSGGGQVTQAVKKVTTTTPIVTGVSGDPVGTGVIKSLAQPGGNITGLSIMSPELSGKRLALLKEAVPSLARLAVLYNATVPDKALDLGKTQVAAKKLGIRVQAFQVRGPDDFGEAFAAIKKTRPDGLMALGDPLINSERGSIVEFAAKSRLPAMYEGRVFVKAGGLMVSGMDVADLFRRAASYVNKILKGSNPANIPVEQPRKFELTVNLKTAKKLGLMIPPSVLYQADKVIK
jgi:putative ABC transport system substrate-binding protein